MATAPVLMPEPEPVSHSEWDTVGILRQIVSELREIKDQQIEIKNLLRERNEQIREREARRRRKAAVLSAVAGNDVSHDD